MAESQVAGQALADKNRDHWNLVADKLYSQQWAIDIHTQITDHLRANISWLGLPDDTGRQSKMLDYACGNGVITEVFHERFARIVAVDLSDAMLAGYRKRIETLGLPQSRAVCVRGDLLAREESPTEPPLGAADLSGFDLVAICLALHHVEDAGFALKQLAKRLRPGGVILVIEFLEGFNSLHDNSHGHGHDHGNHHSHGHQHQDHHEHGHRHKEPKLAEGGQLPSAAHTISYSGFSKETMRALFEQAGCDDMSFVEADQKTLLPGKDATMFFARAVKKM